MKEKLYCLKCNEFIGQYFPEDDLYRSHIKSEHRTGKNFLGLPAEFACKTDHKDILQFEVFDFVEGKEIICSGCEETLGEFKEQGGVRGIVVSIKLITDEKAKVVYTSCCGEPYNLEKLKKAGKSIGFNPSSSKKN